MANRPVSPLASGGAGVSFEYRVAGLLFSRMLRGAHLPVGAELPLAQVALQQRNVGYHFDDIVAYAHPVGSAPRVQMQVKRRVRPSAHDRNFLDVMKAAAAACRERPDEVADGSLQMALVVGERTKELEALGGLAEQARAHTTSGSYRELFRPGVTNLALRQRYDQVVEAVAAGSGVPSGNPVHDLTHRILRAMHVWQVGVERDDADWRMELDGLSSVTLGVGIGSAELLQYLCGMAEQTGSASGVFDAVHLRAELQRRLGIQLASRSQSGGSETRSSIIVNNDGTGQVFVAHGNQVFNGLNIRF